MAKLTATFRRAGGPVTGTWRLELDQELRDFGGQVIHPAGLYRRGELVNSTAVPSLVVTLPGAPTGLFPQGAIARLEVTPTNGTERAYRIPLHIGDVDLGTLVDADDYPDGGPLQIVGVPGGVARLDSDGDVVDAAGEKVTGGTGQDPRFPTQPTRPPGTDWVIWYQTDPDNPTRVIDAHEQTGA